ncbi:protein translocase subunit SecF, partial [bacterium]|nr:protein translocase subunit SecF [bacterium]MBT6017912.1 protein translocase subunit SecF [bacterium]MBT6776719.1 protein translocase subunit SecF [bacterium]
ENLKTLKRGSIVDTVNRSINESLSRTIVTSMTTLFVVLVLYFFGGEVIHSFSFALIIGVLVGTYSSIFVASLIVVYMQPKS